MKTILVNENQENQNIFSDEDYNFIYKKLEYTFKKNGYPIIDKILNKEKLTNEELTFLLKKFEYTFRKSNPEIIERIKKHLGLEELSNILYSRISAKRKRDLKNLEKD